MRQAAAGAEEPRRREAGDAVGGVGPGFRAVAGGAEDRGRIVGFIEKPKNPPEMPGRPGWSLVSMGNYLFRREVLERVLVEDGLTENSRHDFGRDARAWTAFWNENQARSRIEWLIDALDPSYPRSSKAAADELREEAGELFGYAEEQSPAERRQVQEKFRTWWQSASAGRRSTSP